MQWHETCIFVLVLLNIIFLKIVTFVIKHKPTEREIFKLGFKFGSLEWCSDVLPLRKLASLTVKYH